VDLKADKTAMQTALDAKADKTALDLKADKTAVDLKADKTAVDLKADKTALDPINTALNSKAKKQLQTKNIFTNS
jgi:hypothetical protein